MLCPKCVVDVLMSRRGRPPRGLGTGSRVVPSNRRVVVPSNHMLETAVPVPPPATALLGRKRKSMVILT